MRALTSLAFFLGVLLGLPASGAEPIDFGAAIDQVGRLRMLSQRIVKAYGKIGLDVRKDEGTKQLAEAIEHFDAAILQVQLLAAPARAADAIARLEDAWRPFRHLALGPVTRDGAGRLDAQGERLLEAAHALVVRLEEHAGAPESTLVNLAGRQRMLIERLAKLYLLRVYGVDSPGLRERSRAARKEFYAALVTLEAAPENTEEIAHELRVAAAQWEWLRHALTVEGTRPYALGVAEASEKILARMDRLTALYAGLARPRSH